VPRLLRQVNRLGGGRVAVRTSAVAELAQASTLGGMTSPTRWLDDDQQALWQDLLTVVIGLPALLDRQMQADAGISNFEYSVLARLSMTEASTMRLSDLAAQCTSTLPRLSKVMVRFEEQGWVTRCPDPDNGRYTLATLTDAGRQKVVDSAPGHVEQVRALVFEPLTAAQQRQLGVVLSRLAGPVREQLGGR
jgi:DNA-binding MarR family transcriptional regulator